MPLIKSKSKEAFKTNVKTLMGDVGKSPHVQSRDQALAIAFDVRRRARADGGKVHLGPIVSTVPGRTDHHPMEVPSGAYVIPAETVSHLGENNTLAGLKILDHMFGPNSDYANAKSKGGRIGDKVGEPVPINAAGGEYVIPPEIVAAIGGGDIGKGHAMLDKWVLSQRKKHIKTLQNLDPPAKD